MAGRLQKLSGQFALKFPKDGALTAFY